MAELVVASASIISPSSVAAATSVDLAAITGIAAALLLLLVLVVKELLYAYASEERVAGTSGARTALRLAQSASIAAFPLAAVFVFAVLVKILQAL